MCFRNFKNFLGGKGYILCKRGFLIWVLKDEESLIYKERVKDIGKSEEWM